MKNKVIFLVGPTAVGKSDAAVSLAKKINAEIISCDSMQIYKGMDIISSQPSASLRKRVPHHFIGIISPSKEYNVSKYRKDAIKVMEAIIDKGKVPLFAGGTGLYRSILIDGIFDAKTEDKNIRKKLYKEADSSGNQFMHDKLQKIDPEAALKIHPNDLKRVIRALEVFETTGKPISYFQKLRCGLADKYEIKSFCLNMQRDKLYQRIEQRIAKMFRKGLVKEVSGLLKLKLSKTASYAIGIRELKGYFDANYDLNEAKRQMIRNTCLYSKRQLTWFRKDKRIKWVEVNPTEKPKEIAGEIYKLSEAEI